MCELVSLIKQKENKLFAVQYVCRVKIEDEDEAIIQISTCLVSAKNIIEANKIAQDNLDSFEDEYNNKEGKRVRTDGIGIHSISEDIFAFDNVAEVACFLFSNKTTTNDLLDPQEERKDLPLIDGA